MHSLLQDIIANKREEVAQLHQRGIDESAFVSARSQLSRKSFRQAIMEKPLAFIGEIKRKSPSKGHLAPIADPLVLLDQYVQGGINAVSVLTDQAFAGTLADLQQVTQQLVDQPTPVLRKDFMIDALQIKEAVIAGANAILLIVAVLQEKTAELLAQAQAIGIDVIVEVHDLEELQYAVEIGSDIIGINNRNLKTFEEDIEVGLSLVNHIPEGIVTIAESALRTPEDIQRVHAAGFDAVLIGEALVKAGCAKSMLQQMRASL